MKRPYTLLPLALLIFTSLSIQAQTTLENVYTLMQTNCSGGSGCHSDVNPQGFSVGNTPTEFYNNVFNVDPTNSIAAAKNHKLVMPGYPERSFLLRKMGNCLSHDLVLDDLNAEGETMPLGEFPLQDHEIELVRQWIQFNAPTTGNVTNENLIEDYYVNGGLDKLIAPEAPPECDGFQMHMGPFFLDGGEEVEYLIKKQLDMLEDIEVHRIEVFMNIESHHFIIYKFPNAQDAAQEPEGMRLVGLLGGEIPFNNDFVNAWVDDDDYALPNGTAFFFDNEEVFDLNYHILNYNQTEILPAEVYINVYTQPLGTAQKEMRATLLVDNNTFTTLILPPGQQRTVEAEFVGPNETYGIWMLSSHTHSLGTDFDIFLRNADGTKGQQIYEGFFDIDYTFDQGFYDWEHPPILQMEPFLEIDASEGLIYEADFDNTGNNFVTWGLTTNDEMILVYMQYVVGSYTIPNQGYVSNCTDEWEDLCANKTTGILQPQEMDARLQVYPNPADEQTQILYKLADEENITVEVIDIAGRIVQTVTDQEIRNKGIHTENVDVSELNAGIYFIRLSNGTHAMVKQLIVF